MVMSLQDYIDKYGEKSGTKRYNGVQKLLITRKKTYDSQPYVRFTKEWFIWRYPDDGIDKFIEHVNKSRQSEENMINRWGEELGKKKWQETVAKKNTVALVRSKYGEKAVEEMNYKKKIGRKKFFDSMSDSERKKYTKIITNKSNKTKKERYGNKSKLNLFLEKFGDNGHIEYALYLQKIFKSIGHSKEAEIIIKKIISDNNWLLNYSLYYRDLEDKNKYEWFISSKEGVYFYDFCVRESKSILEYDGAIWHPTITQAKELKNELMQMTGISYLQKYKKDQIKLKMAESNGFKVFIIRSDFSEQQKTDTINKFINYTKEQLNDISTNSI